MAPKKKRTQLKKVDRGYATVSIPKKLPPAPPPEPEAEEPAKPTEEPQQSPEPASTSTAKPDARTSALQALLDKFQEKTEKEVVRVLKSIEYDRRMAKGLPRVDLDSKLQDEINALAGSELSEQNKQTLPANAKDKLLGQTGVTYGVLRRLGFREETVLACLKEASGIDVEQAFDWLFLHCSSVDLDHDKRALDLLDASAPLTPKTDTENSSTPVTPKSLGKKTPLPPSSLGNEASTKNSSPTLVASASASEETKLSSPPPSPPETDESDSDFTNPNDEYVKLKLRITDLTGYRRKANETADNSLLKRLQARLEIVKNDYQFRAKEAEAAFQARRKEADQAALTARLRGESGSGAVKEVKKSPIMEPKPPVKEDNSPKSADTDTLDKSGSDDDSSGGFFDLLEPMPAEETTDTGTVVAVRDMALPKHFTGRTSKTVFQEYILKKDRYAAITYQDISRGSRAKRASLMVRWTGGRANKWAMEDIACHNLSQAEQYIATIALHALTFPAEEGFQNSVGGLKSTQTTFRLLPSPFRDLWNELEEQRKESVDKHNREIWANLEEIVNSRLGSSVKAGPKVTQPLDSSEELKTRGTSNADFSSEQLMSSFFIRQSSFAYQEMLYQRNTLPIAAYRQFIVEMLDMSQVIVLSGETGCGKSTQLPSFILEDQLARGQHCKIVVTEPRRISAISLAQRVSQELGDPPGAVGTSSSLVGYSIRLDSHTSRNTRLTFVTNGIALRMLEGGSGADGQGTAFDEITHIIIDEVHERSIESDFLLIVLKSLIEQRKDLKVILMSATLDADKIANYFGGCPTIHVPGRTFPVDVRYLEDAVEYTRWSISDGSPYAKRLNDKFHRNAKKVEWSEELTRNEDDDDDEPSANGDVQLQSQRYSPSTVSTMNLLDERFIPYDLIVELLEKACNDPDVMHMTTAFLVFMPGLGEIRRLNDMLTEHPYFGSDEFQIFPLHSMISSENQAAVFDLLPPGVRKIVIATNIAETGITIPDITCVIDTGKHREMRFDEKRQISRLIETYIARSNAAQRRGRAGRVQPGLCFHLFSKARQEMMAEHPLPEMMRLSLSDLALRIKIMNVKLGSSIEDVLTRALDPPLSVNIQRAVSSLVEVQALTPNEDITPMGRLLSKLPTDVHLGKFLLLAALFRCLDPALTIAATLNSKSPFLSPFGQEQEADRAKASFKTGNSDFLTIHNAFSTWRKISINQNQTFLRKFCRQYFLSHQNLQQIEELRQQYLGYLADSSFINTNEDFVKELNRARYSRGYRTRFVEVPPEHDQNSTENAALLNAALCAGLYPKLIYFQGAEKGPASLRTLSNNQPVAFHPSSVNHGRRPQDFGVNYLCYFTIMQSKRLYAWETGPVDDLAILLLCGDSEFKLIGDTISVDRKIKYRASPKTTVALKYLRAHLASILAAKFRGGDLTDQERSWYDVAMRVLGKVKVQDGEGLGISIR